MSLFVDGAEPSKIFAGDTAVASVFVGAEKVWPTDSWTQTSSITGFNSVGPSAMTRDGKTFYSPLTNEPKVVVVDTGSNSISRSITVTARPYSLVLSKDEKTIYAATNTALLVVDLLTDTVTTTIPSVNGNSIAIHPSGEFVYVASYNAAYAMSVISTTTNTVVATLPVQSDRFAYGHGLALTPDGSTLYSSSQVQGAVIIIDTATNAVTGQFPSPVGALAVNPCGTELYLSDGLKLYIYDTQTTALLSAMSEPEQSDTRLPENLDANIPGAGLSGLSCSPDSRFVYLRSSTAISNLAVFDLQKRELAAVVPGVAPSSGAIITCLVSPDCKTVYALQGQAPAVISASYSGIGVSIC